MFWLDVLVCALFFSAFGVYKGDNTRVPDADQAELLAKAKHADPTALAALYDQYVGRIYSYVYHRVGQAELAEDLTGQVFMRMLEAIRTGHGWRTSFSGWLYRIAHNLVIDHYRRRNQTSTVELEEVPSLTASEGDPARAVEARLDRERVRAALNRLTEEQAQVVSLRFLEGLSISEVATAMDKTEGAVKALQYRAILALRRVMQP